MNIDATERAELEQLRLATRLSGVYTWSFELGTGAATRATASFTGVKEALGHDTAKLPSELGATIEMLVVPEDRVRVLAELQAHLDGDTERYESEYRICHKDGSVRWTLARGVAVRDDAGRPLRVTGSSVDITRLKQAEDEARAGQEFLELGMKLAGYSVAEIDRRGIAAEDGILKLAGNWEHRGVKALGPENVIDFFKRTVFEDDLPAFLDSFFAINRGEQRDPVEFRSRNLADGSFRWRLGHTKLICDDHGAPMRCIGASVDIHNVKLAEQAARRAMEEARLATELSGITVWRYELADADRGHARPTSGSALAALGYDLDKVPPDWRGRMAIAVLPEDHERVFQVVQDCIDGKTPRFEVECRTRREDGSQGWLLARGITTRDDTGRPLAISGTAVDVTHLKQVEEDARAANERLELAAQLSGFAVTECDLRGTTDADHAMALIVSDAERQRRWPPVMPSQDDFREAIVPEDVPRLAAAVRACISGTSPDPLVEYRRRDARDGAIRWRLGRGRCDFDEAGAPVRYLGVSLDIQELKAAQEEARRAVAQLRLATRLSDVYLWNFELVDGDLANARIITTDAWEPLGYQPDEVPAELGAGLAAAVLAEDHEHVWAALQASVDGKTDQLEVYYRTRHKDGSVLWNLARGVTIRDAAGRAIRIIGTTVDVTRLRRAEEEVRAAKEQAQQVAQQLRLATELSGVGVWGCELVDGDLANAQPAFGIDSVMPSIGYDPDDVPPNPLARLAAVVIPEDQPRIHQAMEDCVAGRTPQLDAECRVFHGNGSVVWRLVRGIVTRDAAGRPLIFMGTAVDITQLKQTQGELQRAREAAEAANRAKDEFLANVSHEIRTPMNAILGMTELALDSAPSEHQRQLLSTVRSAARNLLTIINDLLDFTKIASGKLTLDRADFSLRAAVGDTLRALAVRAHRKGLELLCHVRPDVPDALEGDAGRLRQVLMNLVGNAIKFTPQGEVEVDVAAEPSLGLSVSLIFTVRDTGIGIARDKQATIFRAFEQEDSSTTRRYGGTGLGLTISAQLVSLMDGDITVQSAPGCGSTFRFTARFARSANPDAAAVSPERLANLRVLVVDDNEANRRILVEWLTSWRMQPTSACDAAQALAGLASAHAAGAPFSLVLLDARMPDTDGVALAGEIRRRWGPGAPRLILLSSDDSAGLSTLARENGVLAYLLKPVQQSELLEAIWAAMNLELTVPTSAGPAGGQPARSRPVRVLVAEDNELNVALLQELLRQRGHVAQFARDGRAALELALQGELDLMLLDLHMPELDGFEVVEAIRDHERGTNQHLRIIALTARSSARDRERCLAAGMDEFLAKPIEAAALWATIERLVARWPLAASAPRAVEPGLLDARAILRACGGRAAILDKLRAVLRRTLPLQMSRVRAGLASGDLKELREAAHQLVGTVGAFSTVTAGIASALEEAAIRDDRGSCVVLVERLGSLCDALLDATATLSMESVAL